MTFYQPAPNLTQTVAYLTEKLDQDDAINFLNDEFIDQENFFQGTFDEYVHTFLQEE